MTTYTISYYEGEERPLKINNMVFHAPEDCLEFIISHGLHPDYISITEWENDEYIESINALHYIN